MANKLPTEIITHVMRFLSVSDRKESSLVSKKWYEASLDPILLKDTIVKLNTPETSVAPILGLGHRKNPHLILSDIDGSITSRTIIQESCRHLCQNLQSLSLKGADVTEAMLMTILSHCYSLEVLDLSSCNSLFMTGQLLAKDSDVERLKDVLKNVKEVNLSSIRYLSDATFHRIFMVCENVSKISVASCQILFHSDTYCPSGDQRRNNSAVLTFKKILNFITDKAQQIKSLSFSRTAITNFALNELANIKGLRLKEIDLSYCKELSDDGVVKLCKKQPEITVMKLANCVELKDPSAYAIVTNLSHLKELDLSMCRQISDNAISKFHRLSDLEKLTLNACYGLSSASLAIGLCKPSLSKLTYLNLNCCSGAKNDFVMELCNILKDLTHLDLGSCYGVSDIGLHNISKNLKHLRYLRMAWCKEITDFGLIGIIPDDPTHYHKEEEGQCKCARRPMVTNLLAKPDLPELKPPALTQEEMERKLGMDGEVYSISNLGSLQVLDFTSCPQITDLSIVQAFKFLELRELHLGMCYSITDDSLIAIAINIPSLEGLHISQCTRITDKGVMYVAEHIQRLSALDISCCDKLTNRSIEALATYAHRLKYLDVSLCTEISIEAVDMLEHALKYLHNVQKRLVSGWAGTV